MADGERLTCAKARRIEALCGEGARVVRHPCLTLALERNGHVGFGHDDTEQSRERALDDLLAWATRRATRDCVDAQQEAAWLAEIGRAAAGPLRVDCQQRAALAYAEARGLYAALTEPRGENEDMTARAAARKGGLLPRDELPTRPYDFTAEELRQRADRLDKAALDLLLLALDLRKMADDIEGGGAKSLTE